MGLIRRSPSEILKRGYSDEELAHIYELGRFFLENGELRKAEPIIHGILEIAPDFVPALLAQAYLFIQRSEFDSGLSMSRQALKYAPEMLEASLMAVCCMITLNDTSGAGTLLGEIGEKVEAGAVERPELVRFYKVQLARFQTRSLVRNTN